MDRLWIIYFYKVSLLAKEKLYGQNKISIFIPKNSIFKRKSLYVSKTTEKKVLETFKLKCVKDKYATSDDYLQSIILGNTAETGMNFILATNPV